MLNSQPCRQTVDVLAEHSFDLGVQFPSRASDTICGSYAICTSSSDCSRAHSCNSYGAPRAQCDLWERPRLELSEHYDRSCSTHSGRLLYSTNWQRSH